MSRIGRLCMIFTMYAQAYDYLRYCDFSSLSGDKKRVLNKKKINQHISHECKKQAQQSKLNVPKKKIMRFH